MKKRINRHEKNLAKNLGGWRTPMSGGTDGYKGDIQTEKFLIDDKHTDGSSIRVTKDMLVKINKEAREAGKVPCLSLSFENMGLAGNTWFLIPMNEFKEIDGV